MSLTDFSILRAKLSPHASVIVNSNELKPYFKDTTEEIGSCLVAIECSCREDVVTAVRFCQSNGLTLTPRGAGTGLSGGATPQGGAVLSTTRMNNILIDQEHQRAWCGPGAITKDIQDIAASFGLTYPPDPASYTESTIGGNIAEGAGGLRCKRFGVTRDYVLGLEMVLPDGSLLSTGTMSQNRGLNWTDLMTGSEGTLGILTQCELQLIPTPQRGSTVLAFFPTVSSAGEAVAAIVAQGIIPTVLEFMDGGAVKTALAGLDGGFDFPAPSPILLMESNDRYDPIQTRQLENICRSARATWIRAESNPEKSEPLWLLRRSLSRAVKSKAAFWLSEDVAVPVSRFAELVDTAADLKMLPELDVVCFGHAGDGNLHAVFMLTHDTKANRKLVDSQVERLMDATLAMRGTITGEHGIGLAKRQFLEREFNAPTLMSMRLIKKLLDADNKCNPGKIFTS